MVSQTVKLSINLPAAITLYHHCVRLRDKYVISMQSRPEHIAIHELDVLLSDKLAPLVKNASKEDLEEIFDIAGQALFAARVANVSEDSSGPMPDPLMPAL